MNYLNILRNPVCNSEIIEYDIQNAGFSLIKEYNLLPKKVIEKLSKIEDKKIRNIMIGKIRIKNQKFNKNFEKIFDLIINTFIEKNCLDKEWDIISIKKDAVFTIGKVKHVNFGNYILFKDKNIYTDYMQLVPISEYKISNIGMRSYEFYYNYLTNDISIKGLNDDDYQNHKTWIKEIITWMRFLHNSGSKLNSRDQQYLSEFITAYKNFELENEYYREFNTNGKYRLLIDDGIILTDSIDDTIIENNLLDIRYNYFNLVLPFIRLII